MSKRREVTGIALGMGLSWAAACNATSTNGAGGSGGSAASCDSPGEVQTPTAVSDGSPTTFNVAPLACTRTATALGCELGTTHAYTETVSGTKRKITANGVANHDVGAFPNSGNPNTIAAQSYTYEVPVTPSGQGSSTVKVFGILTSGVVLDPGTAETWNDDATWRYEALRYGTAKAYFSSNGGTDATFHPDALGVDCNMAHVQPDGAYHYHGVPMSLVPDDPAVTFVGWAADGHPIVVLYDHDDAKNPASAVRAMKSSYAVKQGTRASGPGGTYDGTFGADWEYVAGSGDLDECNGRDGEVTIAGQKVTTYHYVLTQTFPFIPRCWKAAPDASFAAQAGGGGMGPPACSASQTSMCCGDGACGGPETTTNCPADCH